MSKKIDFADKVIKLCTAIIEAHVKGYDMRDIFNDREYNPGGVNAIIDNDISSLEIKAEDVTKAMQFFENFQKMLDGQQVTVADYRVTLNKMRIDIN